MTLDLAHLQQWIGKTESRTDLVSATPVQGLAALLDSDEPEPEPGDALRPGAHWLYAFTPLARQSLLGADGHPARGGFLPPVPLPRRMWAGSRLAFHRPLRVGEPLQRVSTVVGVSSKAGRSGPLVFVQVRHAFGDGSGGLPAVVEEQDIVYRGDPQPGDAAPAPVPAPAPEPQDFARSVTPDAVLLARYSGLTHNGHRIHYDRPYAMAVEGYPGLVVHGPLIATLLLDLVRREAPNVLLKSFAFRAVKPLFDTAPFGLCGRPAADGQSWRLWAKDEHGALAMDATAVLA